MILQIEIQNEVYKFDLSTFHNISIALDFYGAQPNAYGVEKARSKPCRAGSLTGDTRQGGSCNFEQIKLIPHCNGTHTESIGHITHERISIHDCLKDALIPSVLITVQPENAAETDETYSIKLNENDRLITKKVIESALENADANFLQGLIVRTLPNDESKLSKTYLSEIPPFFSTEAMQLIRETGVRHLLVDLPSIDRIFDEGKLSNHRFFWNVAPGSFESNENSLPNNTITELIFAPDTIKDGNYLLNLQIAPFVSDAAPSRPVLFKTETRP